MRNTRFENEQIIPTLRDTESIRPGSTTYRAYIDATHAERRHFFEARFFDPVAGWDFPLDSNAGGRQQPRLEVEPFVRRAGLADQSPSQQDDPHPGHPVRRSRSTRECVLPLQDENVPRGRRLPSQWTTGRAAAYGCIS